jgi:two-component system, cell cycle sensor histidine kinase PleC
MKPDMTSRSGLKESVEARDRLVLQTEHAQQALQQQLALALGQGDLASAQAAVGHTDARLGELAENLRIYQAELHAQADELAASQARTDVLLARFSTLFTRMPVAALLVGTNGEVLEFNGRAEGLLGLRHRSPAARFMHRLVQAQAYQERVRPAFLEAQATGASTVDDVPCIGANGQTFTGELHVAWLPSGAPGLAPGPYVCALMDRTEHLQHLHSLRSSEEALRQSEAFLADSARLAGLGGWELTLQPRAWRFAPELRSLLDLPPEAPAALETLLDCCVWTQRDALAAAVRGAESGLAFELELDLRTATGRELRVLAVGRPEVPARRVAATGRADADAGMAADVRAQRVSGVLQDITGSTLARQQIGELTERLSVASAAGGIGVWDWVLDSGVVVLDSRMARLLDLPAAVELPEQELRRTMVARLHADSAAELATALTAAVGARTPINLELRRRPVVSAGDVVDAGAGGSEGAERWLHLSGRTHAGADGRAVRVVGLAWDCSAEHESARLLAAKDAAEQASRSKSAFLSRMSHELRTPLNAILGFSQLMRMEAEAGDLVLKPHRVSLIETAARHLLDLVNEVLDVSRIESGQVEVHLMRFDVRGVVQEALPLVQGLADSLGVHLTDRSAAAAPGWVLGDRLRLKEVLINLLSNAVKYNRRGGHVEVQLRSTEGGCELAVADTGIGLDAQQQAALFQPFNRLGAEASGIEGAGMGLFVSRRFVELMGGRIDVDSRPGQGTTFSVRLNAAPAA